MKKIQLEQTLGWSSQPIHIICPNIVELKIGGLKMKTKTLLLTCLLIVGSLQAATIGYTNSVAMPNDQNVTVSLSQFDSSLGTLTAVYIKYYVAIAGANVQLDNDSGSVQSGTARVQNLVNSWTGPNTLNASFGQIVETADMQLNESQTFALGATSGDTVGLFNVTGNSDYVNWSPGILEAGDEGFVNSVVWDSVYVGTGNIDSTINATYSTTASFDGSNGYFQGNTPSGTFTGEVIYTYTPIPEPATASMMIFATLLTLLIRRQVTA